MPGQSKKKISRQLPVKVGDALDGEVALRAKVDQTGLTVAGKSRALAAADQLLGGLIGIPGGWIEGIRRRNELRRGAQEQFLETDIAAAMQQVEGLSDLGQATMRRLLHDEYHKQENRASVWIAAEENLALPPPEKAEDKEAGESEPVVDINPDWLNRFTSFAQDVSTEELQGVWGRLLAGEIRRPGSFSISSLRVLAELDAEVARSFDEVFRQSVAGHVPRPEKFEGEVLERFAVLENAGLVQADTFLQMQIQKNSDGFGYFLGETHLLKVTPSANSTVINFPVIRITRIGMQIGAILLRDEAAAIRKIALLLKPVEKVEMCLIHARMGTRITWSVLETFPPNK
jgi:hypothetical protein